MKKMIAVLLLVSTLSSSAWAVGVLKSGYVMCTSEDGLDTAIKLIIQHRNDMLRSIGCYPTADGIDGAVIDRGFITSKVLLRFASGESAVVWVPSEAISKK